MSTRAKAISNFSSEAAERAFWEKNDSTEYLDWVPCDGCVAYHTRAAWKHGLSRLEVAETVATALYMGGGPATVYGADALRAYDEFSTPA